MNLEQGDLFRDKEHSAVRFIGEVDGTYSFQIFESSSVLDVQEDRLEEFVGMFDKITKEQWIHTIVAKHCWQNRTKLSQLFGGVPSYEKMYVIISEVQDKHFVDMMYKELEQINLIRMMQEQKGLALKDE